VILLILFLVFLFGLTIGSFLNVCIIRLPLKQTIVTDRSHCMKCDYQLKWYDLVPLVSWLMLKGRCRNCKEPISKQYPIIEAVNGIAWVVIVLIRGMDNDLI